MQWFFLGLAIIGEVFASCMLKASAGFSRPWPVAGMMAGYGFSFWFLALALKTMPLGTAYAIWAGVGLVLTALASIMFFGQKADVAGLLGMGLILSGVVVLNTLSKMNGH